MHDVYLLLGSNLGDRKLWLAKARELIAVKIGEISLSSSLYQTASWGKTSEPYYINQVLLLKSASAAIDVLNVILDIEKLLGRKREGKWGSRIIDIDILFYGDMIINEPGLAVPHPFLHQRRFTLEPLLEIAPEFEHPVLKSTVTELCKQLTDNLKVQRLEN